MLSSAAFELPPGECVAGVAADSSCALSLLSTQPWDTTSHDHRSPAMPAAGAFDGTPVAPSVMASSYAASSAWTGSRDPAADGARNAQRLDDALHLVHPGSAAVHFSGELELALQGSGGPPHLPRVDHGGSGGGTFNHSTTSAMNWFL